MDKPLSQCMKMEFVCKIDGKKFDTEKQLHMHLRKHKMRMAEYYQKYYPRRDMLTGDLIKFNSTIINYGELEDFVTENKFTAKDIQVSFSIKTTVQNI